MSLRKRAGTAADYYLKANRVLVLVSAFIVFALMVYISADAGGRSFFDTPMPATYEMSQTAMVYIVFLALAFSQARGAHLRLDFLVKRLSPRGQAILNAFALLIGLVVFALIFWQTWWRAVDSFVTKEYMEGLLGIPYYPARFAVAIGAFLLWIQFAIDLVRSIDQFVSVRKARPQ
jgi:TRAP-type C4-dicarboxylate transport system permease small subunit